MGVEYLQANLTSGELAPELHARPDITKFNNGIKTATNMIIIPYGGLKRRPGLAKITDSKIATDGKMFPFVFNSTQSYLVVLRPLVADIFRDGELVSSETTPFTGAQIDEIDVIQSADTMIFAHELHTPQSLQRQGSDTSWLWEDITFANMPYFNFGTVIIEKYVNSGMAQTVTVAIDEIVLNRDGNAVKGANYTYYKAKTTRSSIDLSLEDFSNTTNWSVEGTQEVAWSVARGYPRTCTFHGGRLWFAGSTAKPTSIWGSKINGFFDFDLGASDPDEGIADILDSDQYNIIQNIFSGRKLQVFTTGGEFYNTNDSITPENSNWSRQTGYGSKKIRPILIDGATLFVDSSGRTIRQFVYDFNEDSYVSHNASLLSSHLITLAVSMSAIKGTQHNVGDYVYVINEDGTVAVLSTMRHEEIAGWTPWETDGDFKDVCVVDKETYFIVQREGTFFIERLAENTYTDHNVTIDGVEPDTFDVVHTGSDVVHSGDDVIYTQVSSGSLVYEITTDYDNALLNKYFKVIADYSIMAEAKPTGTAGDNTFAVARGAYRLEVGLNFTTSVITLPLSTETKSGNTLHRRKRVIKVDVNVLDSLGVYANDNQIPDRVFPIVLDEAPTPYTGFKEMYLLGYDRLVEIEISQTQPLPFTLRAIGYEVGY